MYKQIADIFDKIDGKVGFYYRNLVTGQTICYQENLPLVAASVIKLPILITAFTQLSKKEIQKEQRFLIAAADKLPSCGALTYLHEGIEVTLEDLYTLMIILSDNTATNLLIRYLGMEQINLVIQQLGLQTTKLNRLLFDSQKASQGIENIITAAEMGALLERLYRGEIISREASQEMLCILQKQRLNGKIPFFIPHAVPIAHKTGEDSGITHDVGIVFAKQPFVVCFCANEVDAPRFERVMQDVSKLLFDTCNQ